MSKNTKHNLDSQICNIICENINWVLPNHDAWTIHPNQAEEVREIYTNFMYNLWKNRKKILNDYFQSIGITKEYEEKQYEELDSITSFSPYCLK